MPEPVTVTTRELSGDFWRRRFDAVGIRVVPAKPETGFYCHHHHCIADSQRGCPLCLEDYVYNVRAKVITTAYSAGEARLRQALRELGKEEGNA